MGTFTFEGEFPKIAMLSGGIGITPLRSMCRFIVDSGLRTSVCLLYGNRSLEEIAFRADFDAMQRQNPRFKVVHCLGSAGPEWTGRRGNINAAMVREEIPDYAERVFFLCGPPRMVDALTAMLRNELQLPEPQIKTEGFTGY
jgi:ferredoxin-NADP reductase